MTTVSMAEWAARLRAALAEVQGGGGQPPAPDACRSTGIAANIPPTCKRLAP